MKKIVLLGNTPSSFFHFRQELVAALQAQGYQVYCLAYGFSAAEQRLIQSWGAIAISHQLNTKGLNPWADIVATVKLKALLQTIRPDAVMAFFVKPVIFGAIAAKLAKIPRTLGMIEGLGNAFTLSDGKPSLKARLIKPIQIGLYRLSLPQLNQVIFLNPDDYHDLISRYRINVRHSHILGGVGVDLTVFAYCPPPQTTAITFLFIGRLLKEKGIFEYLQAAQIIKQRHPNAIFQIIGDFDDHSPFALQQDFLDEYIAQNMVEYHGYVDDVATYIRNAHVFVLPSYREGVPRSSQEAMAIGRPIITTDVPGCRATVQEGINGFLTPPWNGAALAEHCQYFIDHPERITPMGLASRQLAEQHYDVHAVNRRLLAILEAS